MFNQNYKNPDKNMLQNMKDTFLLPQFLLILLKLKLGMMSLPAPIASVMLLL